MGQDKIMPHKRRELIDKFVCLFVFFLCECNKNSKLLTSVSFIYIYKEFMPVKKKYANYASAFYSENPGEGEAGRTWVNFC